MTGSAFHTEDTHIWANPTKFICYLAPGIWAPLVVLEDDEIVPLFIKYFFWLLVLEVLKEVASCATKYTEFKAEMSFRSSHIEHVLTD